MEDLIKTDRGALDMIQHKLESAPVSVGMENINNSIQEFIDQGHPRSKSLVFAAKAIANRAVKAQNKNFLQYIAQIRTANNTNFAQTEKGFGIIQEASSTIDRLNNQRDEANRAERNRQKEIGDEDIKTRYFNLSSMTDGQDKKVKFDELIIFAASKNRSDILRSEMFYSKEIKQLRRDQNIQHNSWEDKLNLVKKVYTDSSEFYKNNPDNLIVGVLSKLQSQEIKIEPQEIEALKEYVKGWVSIGDTDGYKGIISRVESEAKAYVKLGIAATEGEQGKASEPSNMASIIEKHTNIAQEALQEIFEEFMEKNKDKDGNYKGYKRWDDEGDFGKKVLEDTMRAKLGTLLSSEEGESLKGELKTAIESVGDDPKTKEQRFNAWRDNYNDAKEDKKQYWVQEGLKSGFSDLVESYVKRRKTGEAELNALPIKYLDVGSEPAQLDPIFQELDRLAALGAGGQRRGIEEFLVENRMHIGQPLSQIIKNRIASSKDIRELKVWRDAVSVFNQQILSKFPSWRPAKIELDRLLTPKRGEVGVPDKAVKRISELAGNLEVALVSEYVNFITSKEGYKEFGDWSIKEKGDFNSKILGKVSDFFTKDILDELTKLSGIINKTGNATSTKLKQQTKHAFRAATGGNLGGTFSTDEKKEYKNAINKLDINDEKDKKTLENIYNKAENKSAPKGWSIGKIKLHLLNFGNTEF